jgi:glutamine amidotransferase
MSRVLLVDYGVGNLLSVRRALEHVGAEVTQTSDPDAVPDAERLVLPGVGAFGDCMSELRTRELLEPLIEYARADRPFLGICVGMQMLFDEGEEFGRHAGMGLIPGRVVRIPDTTADGRPHKIPHIGWGSLVKPPSVDWAETLLDGIAEGTPCYFVHSYTGVPADDRHRLADCDYNGRVVSAAVRTGKVYGVQFHPEKSGQNGLHMLERFVHADVGTRAV